MRQGLILLAHAARDPGWRAPFEELAERIRAQRPELGLKLAFLELMAPDPPDGRRRVGSRRLRRAAGRSDLSRPGHVRDDVPLLVDALRKRYSGVAVTQSSAAGEDGGVLDALASFCVGALDEHGSDSPVSLTLHNINYAQYDSRRSLLRFYGNKAS